MGLRTGSQHSVIEAPQQAASSTDMRVKSNKERGHAAGNFAQLLDSDDP